MDDENMAGLRCCASSRSSIEAAVSGVASRHAGICRTLWRVPDTTNAIEWVLYH